MLAAIVLCTALTALAFVGLVAEVRAPRASALPLVTTAISNGPSRLPTQEATPVDGDLWARDRSTPPPPSAVGTDTQVVAETLPAETLTLAAEGRTPVPVPPRPDPHDSDATADPSPTTTSTTAYPTARKAVTTTTTLSRASIADRTPPVTSITLPLAVTSTTFVQVIVTPTTDPPRIDRDDDDPDDRADRECVWPPLRDYLED